jgi:hypothetical protein
MQNNLLPDSAGGREQDGERQDGNGFHNRPPVVDKDVTTVLLLIFAYKGCVGRPLSGLDLGVVSDLSATWSTFLSPPFDRP